MKLWNSRKMKKLNTTIFTCLFAIAINEAYLLSDLTLGNLKEIYSLKEIIKVIPTLSSSSSSEVIITLTLSCGDDNVTQQINIRPILPGGDSDSQSIVLNIDTTTEKTCQITADADEVINAFSASIKVVLATSPAPAPVAYNADSDSQVASLEKGGKLKFTLSPSAQSSVLSKVYDIYTNPQPCLSVHTNNSDTALEQMNFNTLPPTTEFEVRAMGMNCIEETKYTVKIKDSTNVSEYPAAFIQIKEVLIKAATPISVEIQIGLETAKGKVSAKIVLSRHLKDTELASLPQNFTINISDTANLATIIPNKISLNVEQIEYEFSFDKPQPTTENITLTLSKSEEFEGVTLVQPEAYLFVQAVTDTQSKQSLPLNCTLENPIVAKRTFQLSCLYTETQTDIETEKDLRIKPIIKQAGQSTTKLVWMAEEENNRIYGLKFKNYSVRFNLLADQPGDYSVDFELLGEDKDSFNKPSEISLQVGTTLDFAFELQNASRLPSEVKYKDGEIVLNLAPTSAVTDTDLKINLTLKSQTVSEIKHISLNKPSLTFTASATEAQSVKILLDNAACIEKNECMEQSLAVLFEIEENTLNGRTVKVPDAYTFKVKGGKVNESDKAKQENENNKDDLFSMVTKYKWPIAGTAVALLLLSFYFMNNDNTKTKCVKRVSNSPYY